jgi:hypothetical protein
MVMELLIGHPQGVSLRPILPECLKRGECSSPCAMGGRRASTTSVRGEGTAKITATETESDQTTCTPVREAAPSQGTPLYTAPGEQWALAIWGDRIVWITQVATYRQRKAKARMKRETFNSKPRGVTA